MVVRGLGMDKLTMREVEHALRSPGQAGDAAALEERLGAAAVAATARSARRASEDEESRKRAAAAAARLQRERDEEAWLRLREHNRRIQKGEGIRGYLSL